MNKKKWIRIVSVYSMIYTAITLLSSVLYLCNDIWINFTGLFVLLCVLNTAVCVFEKKRGSKEK